MGGYQRELFGTERENLAGLRPMNLYVSLPIKYSSVGASLSINRHLTVYRNRGGEACSDIQREAE